MTKTFFVRPVMTLNSGCLDDPGCSKSSMSSLSNVWFRYLQAKLYFVYSLFSRDTLLDFPYF